MERCYKSLKFAKMYQNKYTNTGFYKNINKTIILYDVSIDDDFGMWICSWIKFVRRHIIKQNIQTIYEQHPVRGGPASSYKLS